jgi:hypothetical protein
LNLLNLWLPLASLGGVAAEWTWSAAKNIYARAAIGIRAVAIGSLTAHDTWQRVFVDPAAENNPYAYAHTVENLLRLPPRLEQLAKADNGENRGDLSAGSVCSGSRPLGILDGP